MNSGEGKREKSFASIELFTKYTTKGGREVVCSRMGVMWVGHTLANEELGLEKKSLGT